MAHFAEIGKDNKVIQVIVVHNNELQNTGGTESESKGIDFCEELFGHRNWVQTSYNGNMRYNFASQGYTYDEVNDAFYAPQPFASWSLNDDFIWEAPIPMPEDDNIYAWDEENQEWKIIELTIE